MVLVQGNKIPLTVQVTQTLKQRVRTGLYPVGNALPSIRHLCKEFNVSQGIVQHAIRKLEEAGVVKAHHGKGILVQDEDSCEQAAIFFGFIHPYLSSMGFHRDILEYVDEAFSERSNFAVVRSSKDNPILEREIAEHLIANGVKGLILWPTNDDTNGEYFQKLSQKIPVVLVDRLMAGADLPTVVLDYHACGREICHMLLGKMNKKRVLVLMDNLRISSYQDIYQGIDSAARELERSKDVTIVQLPITQEVIQKINNSDFSEVPHYAEYLDRLLAEGGYDAVFCTQDEFLDYCFAQTGLAEKFPKLQPATFRATGPNERSIKYTALKCLEWFSNSGNMIAGAADLVQRWVLTRQMPKDTVRLKFKLAEITP
jgi:DNA-binding transcriptional regulator YhcF (GntR family)